MNRTQLTAGMLVLVMCVGCASTNTTQQPAPSGPTQVNTSKPGTVPVGQLLDVRLQTPLSSSTAKPEQRFEATTATDLMQGDKVLIPAGSPVRGVVMSVKPAGRLDRSGSLTLAFDRITVNGKEYPIRATATQVFESRGVLEEGKTVGTAGAVGAIVGGILGGLEGALIGAAVGSGGVIAATEGKDIDLPPGTIIRIRLDTPLELR